MDKAHVNYFRFHNVTQCMM